MDPSLQDISSSRRRPSHVGPQNLQGRLERLTLSPTNQLPVPPMQPHPRLQGFSPEMQFYQSHQTQRQMDEQSQLGKQSIQADSWSQQRRKQDAYLMQLYSSPEAMQSLLSNRDKLSPFLETNPVLMRRLQGRLSK